MKKYFGQFYSKNLNKDIKKFKNTIIKNKDKIFIEPFVGEGDLLFIYLEIMENEGFSSKELFKNGKIKCYDISKENVNKLKEKLINLGFEKKDIEKSIFVNDSLKINPLKEEDAFIITNPPYLYKTPAKKLNYDMSYFNTYSDLYELAINLYKDFDGIWIVPSNIYFSTHTKIIQEIITKIDNIVIHQNTKFDDTDISITIFEINNKLNNKELIIGDKIFKIKNNKLFFPEIRNSSKTYKYTFGFYDKDIEKEGKTFITDTGIEVRTSKNIKNSLIIKMFDSTSKQDIGLYTTEGINGDILFNKISSRMYFQLFFNNEVNIELLMKNFNEKIIKLREKYDSAFLTNFLSVSKNNFNRKRMSISQAKFLLNETIKELDR